MIARAVIAVLLIGAGVIAGNLTGEPERAVYANPQYRFRMSAPEFPKLRPGSSVVPVIMQGSEDDGFAPNVNVMVQKVAMTREQFAELSRGQFKEAGLNILSEKLLAVSGKDAILWEYEGPMGGRDLRFLALAVMGPDEVYLATCAALKSNFKKFEAEFRASIGSFALAP